jgi:hypothetical protein
MLACWCCSSLMLAHILNLHEWRKYGERGHVNVNTGERPVSKRRDAGEKQEVANVSWPYHAMPADATNLGPGSVGGLSTLPVHEYLWID